MFEQRAGARSLVFLFDSLKVAVESLFAHKLRTFLTLLGIMIAVASVVLVGSAIEGLEQYVKQVISRELGSNSFAVSKFPRFENLSDEEWEQISRRNQDLHLEDLYFLRRWCVDCEELAGEVSAVHPIRSGTQEIANVRVGGVTENATAFPGMGISEGRFFSEDEARRSQPVCVIGFSLKERLFPDVDPLRRTLKLKNQTFRIVGVLEKKGSLFGQSLDNLLYMPITTFLKTFGARRSVTIRARSGDGSFEDALEQVRTGLRFRHRLRPHEKDDFGLTSADQINREVERFTGTIVAVAAPVTLISLLIGGIVVMNIMLVSVTERTFEIGIRKAVGARNRDVLWQFIVESCLLASIGGILGLLMALSGALLFRILTPLPLLPTPEYVFLPLGISAATGIVFGVYPAYKASRLSPISALGAEK
ncbi:MAG: ABC transporter permease [Acidobacteria bacterium]|nr:ABC transporter permease [Acidobacteriota bacterium]